MGESEERVSLGAWVGALLRLRALWPLPGVLLLLLALPFVPDEAWREQFTTRRTLSRAELSIIISAVGSVFYWLVLVLSRRGLLYTGRRYGMREPTEAELQLVDLGLRLMCLLITYAAPVLLIWGH
jgi:hypothetical protein